MVNATSTGASDLATLTARVHELEARIRRLETDRALKTIEPIAPPSTSRSIEIETALGLTWFNLIGAVVLVIGLGLAAVWANDQGYLSPTLRSLLGAAVAMIVFALGVGGLTSHARGRHAFAIGVALVGAFGMYLIPMTASRIDHVISETAATVIMLGLTVGIGLLSYRFESLALAVFGLCGGLAIPLVANSPGNSWGILFAYLAALVAGYTWIQSRHGWRRLQLLASIGVGAYYARWLTVLSDASALACTIGASIWLAHLLFEHFLEPDDPRPSDNLRSGSLLFGALLGGLGLLFASDDAPLLRLLAFSGLLSYHVYLWRRAERPRAIFALLGMCSLGGLYLVLTQVVAPSGWFAPAVITLVPLPFVVLYLTYDLDPARTLELEDHAVLGAATGIFVMHWIVCGVVWNLLPHAALIVAMLAAIVLGASSWKRDSVTHTSTAGDWAYCAAVLMAAAATVLALAGASVGPQRLSLWASLVTVGYALVLVAGGVRHGHGGTRVTGLVLLTVALTKLLVLDLWTLSTGPRIAAFVTLGLGLLGASFLYGRFADRDATARPN